MGDVVRGSISFDYILVNIVAIVVVHVRYLGLLDVSNVAPNFSRDLLRPRYDLLIYLAHI